MGQAGEADAALGVYEQLQRSPSGPNAFALGSVVAALGKAGRLPLALQLFDEATGAAGAAGPGTEATAAAGKRAAGAVQPDLVCYNTLLQACSRAGDWQVPNRVLQCDDE